MRPIVNMPQEDRATNIGIMHKKFGKDRACGSRDIVADRQTDPQTDILITILCNRSHGRSNNKDDKKLILWNYLCKQTLHSMKNLKSIAFVYTTTTTFFNHFG